MCRSDKEYLFMWLIIMFELADKFPQEICGKEGEIK